MYWGEPVVDSSIENGGVVQQGAAADFTRSLADLDPGQFTDSPPIEALIA